TLRIGDHAAELVDPEGLAALAAPGLPVEDGAGAVELDQDGDEQQQRQGGDEQAEAQEDGEAALDGAAQTVPLEAVGEDQPARMDAVEIGPAGLTLEKGRAIDHPDAVHATVEQRLDRHAAAAVVEGHD